MGIAFAKHRGREKEGEMPRRVDPNKIKATCLLLMYAQVRARLIKVSAIWLLLVFMCCEISPTKTAHKSNNFPKSQDIVDQLNRVLPRGSSNACSRLPVELAHLRAFGGFKAVSCYRCIVGSISKYGAQFLSFSTLR